MEVSKLSYLNLKPYSWTTLIKLHPNKLLFIKFGKEYFLLFYPNEFAPTTPTTKHISPLSIKEESIMGLGLYFDF